jgi:hypothetical protein
MKTFAAILLLAFGAVVVAAQEMPDPKQMSGMPLPVGDVPVGTVTVRVIKGSLDKVIPDQPVELFGGGAPITMKTNEMGRAVFSALKPGTRVKASTTVAGETIESQEFAVPAAGGIRIMLVATDPELEKKKEQDLKLAQAPAQPGMVVLGDQSRFVVELGEDGLNVFCLFQVLNSARTPVSIPQPLVFDLPGGAEHAAVLEESTKQAVVTGTHVTVRGPFAPGTTPIQFAYSLRYSSGDVTIAQKLPAALSGVSVMVQKMGDMQLSSPQLAEHRDMNAQGQIFIVGQGPALRAGDTVTLNLTGVPHPPMWPRNLALALAGLILGGGAWYGVKGPRAGGETRRRKLQAERDRLFGELTSLEEQHRALTVDPARYASRRRELVAALERLYAELDEEVAA